MIDLSNICLVIIGTMPNITASFLCLSFKSFSYHVEQTNHFLKAVVSRLVSEVIQLWCCSKWGLSQEKQSTDQAVYLFTKKTGLFLFVFEYTYIYYCHNTAQEWINTIFKYLNSTAWSCVFVRELPVMLSSKGGSYKAARLVWFS